jgi:hypothetical protein
MQRLVASSNPEATMSIRRSLAVVTASLALLGSAAACSGGGGNPLASNPDEPAAPAPRDTSGFIPGTPPLS